MSLDSIVNVQISRSTAAVTQAGFGIPLILGPKGFDGEVREYSSLSAMAEDYAASDAEYIMAQKLFAQSPRIQKVKTALASTPVAQVVTVTPDVSNQEVFEYVVTIDGTKYAFEGDADPTEAEIVAGLTALINADADAKVTASGSTTLILTADNAGEPFTYSVGSRLSATLTTPSKGIAEDIAAVIDIDPDWYFLLTTAKDDTTVKVAANTIETMRRMYLFLNDDADVRTNATDDLVSELKAQSLFRTGVFYSGTAADRGDAGFVGKNAPFDPGSETWALKTISGVTVDAWTDSEKGYLDDKNANYYVQIAGVNVTRNGKVVGGEYIDVIRFIDWLQARMQERIFTALVNSRKIPFTDAGIAVIESCMREVLEAGIRAGGIVEYTVTVPRAADISSADKAARNLTGLSFTATLAGAIHAVTITGNVSL